MIERIPDLPYNAILPSNAKFPFYLPDDDTTYHVNAGDFLSGLADPGDAWNEFSEYSIGDIKSYNGEVWISTANNNTGNPPGPASAFWDLEPDPPQLGGIRLLTFSTTGAIVIDVEGEKEIAFKGSAPITAAKAWSFLNFASLVAIRFIRFEITGGLYVQNMPLNTKVVNPYNAVWNAGTRDWTPLAEGKYEARVTYDGSEFVTEIHGPY